MLSLSSCYYQPVFLGKSFRANCFRLLENTHTLLKGLVILWHVFLANSLSIYFSTNLTHLDSGVFFFIFFPADITMSEIKGLLPSSSSCYTEANYQICYRNFAALTQTWSQATQQSLEHIAESGVLTGWSWNSRLMNQENVAPIPNRHVHMCGLERKTPNPIGEKKNKRRKKDTCSFFQLVLIKLVKRFVKIWQVFF